MLQWMRRFAPIIAAVCLTLISAGPSLLGLLVVGRRSRDPDDVGRGSADPTKPGAYDMWSVSIIPVPRVPDLNFAQTSELIVENPETSIGFQSVNESGGVRKTLN